MPRLIRLPGGYEIRFYACSESYMQKLAVGINPVWAISFDFGDKVPGRKLGPAKRAHVYFRRDMDTLRFADKLQHEVHHSMIEWGGRMYEDIREAA